MKKLLILCTALTVMAVGIISKVGAAPETCQQKCYTAHTACMNEKLGQGWEYNDAFFHCSDKLHQCLAQCPSGSGGGGSAQY